jgi:hypothetical protein
MPKKPERERISSQLSTIRRATAEDAPKIADLFLRAFGLGKESSAPLIDPTTCGTSSKALMEL